MEVKIFRLQSGEDIVSEFTSVMGTQEYPSHYKLKNPLKVVYYTTGIQTTDKFVISLLPWMFTSLTKTQEFIIMPRDVLTMGEPSDKLLAYYVEINKKLSEMFTSIPMANEVIARQQKTPEAYSEPTSVEEELDMMDDNESRVSDDEFLEMVQNKMKSIGKKTLH